ncbi:hypothetical protein BDW59DRAFT_158326 [Aspergillus cavernicola]|uniref:FG-GAP repeat protein n=1 Tax=Aspergillus cavernicola TaxID=176166 RepID=A0ABR4IT86_9EURO
MFADLNGDGRDDYIYVDPDNGEVSAWINRLKSSAGVWQWQSLGRIAGDVGATNDTLQMVDIDGDGRADLCLVDQESGEVTAWLNTGADDMPDYYKLGVIATAASAAPGTTVYLGDFTGEGRADYMIVGEGGKVKALANHLQEPTLVPRWLEDLVLAEWPDGAEQEEVRLVDMTGDGKVDYLVIDKKTGKVTLWGNNGIGGKYQPGEGVILRDSEWFENLGPDAGWGWRARGEIAAGPKNTIEAQFGWKFKAKNVRFADLDGDGLDDYLCVNDQEATVMWQFRGLEAPLYELAKLVADGVGVLAQQVQFADTNGDGRLDYVVLGSTTGAARSWHHLGFQEDGSIRWNTPLTFADGMTGDKRADYVSINPDNRGLRLWENRCWSNGGGGDGEGGDGEGGDGGGVDFPENPDDDGDVDSQWTWLSFDGCSPEQKQAIKDAHEDAVTMAERVKGIDLANDPGAMDYFGAPALNKAYQSSIQSVFDHIATFRLSDIWAGYKMNARCGSANDRKYQSRCGAVVAYQWNTKTDATNPNTAPVYNKADALSNMHFCDRFFDYKKLDEAVTGQVDNDDFKWRYDLTKYKNQAYIILHEMMHATVMAYKQNKDRRIVDLCMYMYEYKQAPNSREWKKKLVKADVYQPYYCKILARTASEDIGETGISMNADNYAQYALSKYVQSKLSGKQYPWLPLADKQAESWEKKTRALLVYESDGTFGVNVGALPTDITSNSEDGYYSAHDLEEDEIFTLPNQVDTVTLAPDSDYPDTFNSEIEQWSTYVNTPDPKCAKSGDSAPSGRSSFSAADAEKKIKDFCSDTDLYGRVFTPPISQGTGETKDGKTKALGAYGSYEINGGKDNLWLGAFFASGSCTGMYTWPPTGDGLRDTDLCIDRFRAIINGCDTSTTDGKYGGSLQEVCLVYQVIAVGSDKPDPTGTIPSGDHGYIKCKDTDVGVKDTCTCCYENLPDQTEIFGLPKSGGCKDIDYRPAWTYYEDPDYRPEHIVPARP